MKFTFLAAIAAAAVAVGALPAAAAQITSFAKSTNDGVFTLTAAQQSYFGVAGAEYIGFYRPRAASGQTLMAGDTFDQSAIFASTGNDASILALLNGENAGLSYSGGYLDALGTTTIATGGAGFTAGVAFLFSGSAGNITFAGTSTFNAANTRGALDFAVPSEVPLPAGLPLLLAGLGGLAALRRSRRAA